jgi:hypothetical protein
VELAARVAPLTLARERLLPVDPVLGELLPEGGLVRGRVIGCAGDAATSLALALAARASAAGSWLAIVGPLGVPGLPSARSASSASSATIGVEAAAELGVAIERLVLVDADPGRPQEWAERVAAAADGVEMVLTCPPVGADRVLRLVRQRIQARGAVLITVGAGSGAGAGAGVDLVVEARTVAWEGIGEGAGRLCRRRVALCVTGRRAPRPVRGECWLPGTSGALEAVREHDDTADLPAVTDIHVVPAVTDIRVVADTGDIRVVTDAAVELSRTG